MWHKIGVVQYDKNRSIITVIDDGTIMKKTVKTFICHSCGQTFNRWMGNCTGCNSWNTIEEKIYSAAKGSNSSSAIKVYKLNDLNLCNYVKIKTNISELDRVLGDGFTLGSAILIGGDPGIGKSTLVLQAINNIASKELACLYVSGEESVAQINTRASRLGVNNSHIQLCSSYDVEEVIHFIESNQSIKVLVIDSLQTMCSKELPSAPGTVAQVRHSAFKIIEIAKRNDIILIFIGHITKDGQLAGPKVLEHMVDAVYYFESEKTSNLRIIRTYKNRFGPSNEIGIFEMSEKGLLPVSNPSKIFVSDLVDQEVSGVSTLAGIEGSRMVLFEIQALVLPTFMASPRRAVVGWDINRLSMLIALLGARLNIKLYDKEVYLSVAGGMKVDDPAADLAVAAALISAALNKKIPRKFIFAGEIALSSAVKGALMLTHRLKEAEKLGFTDFVSGYSRESGSNKEDSNLAKITQHQIKNVGQLLSLLFKDG